MTGVHQGPAGQMISCLLAGRDGQPHRRVVCSQRGHFLRELGQQAQAEGGLPYRRAQGALGGPGRGEHGAGTVEVGCVGQQQHLGQPAQGFGFLGGGTDGTVVELVEQAGGRIAQSGGGEEAGPGRPDHLEERRGAGLEGQVLRRLGIPQRPDLVTGEPPGGGEQVVGHGAGGIRPLAGGGVEGGDGRRASSGEQEIGAPDHQRLRRPLADQGAGWDVVEGGDRRFGVPGELGAHRPAQGDQPLGDDIAQGGQLLAPSEEPAEFGDIAACPGQLAQMEQDAHLRLGIAGRLEGETGLLQAEAGHAVGVAQLQVDHRGQPVALDRPGGRSPLVAHPARSAIDAFGGWVASAARATTFERVRIVGAEGESPGIADGPDADLPPGVGDDGPAASVRGEHGAGRFGPDRMRPASLSSGLHQGQAGELDDHVVHRRGRSIGPVRTAVVDHRGDHGAQQFGGTAPDGGHGRQGLDRHRINIPEDRLVEIGTDQFGVSLQEEAGQGGPRGQLGVVCGRVGIGAGQARQFVGVEGQIIPVDDQAGPGGDVARQSDRR